jgi:uncharacterized protein YecT (DUF1311 family)
MMTVAKPCLGVNETGVSSKRQIECLDRELPVWDKIINDSYKIMMNALEPDQQDKLPEMQRSWIHTPRSDLRVLVRLFPGHDGQCGYRGPVRQLAA